MTTIHAEVVGDTAVLPRSEFERLLALARRTESVQVRLEEDGASTVAMMRLAEAGGAFDFWREEGEDVYTEQDGEPV